MTRITAKTLGTPARVVMYIAAIGLGVTLILAPLTVQGTAVVTGIGVAVSGIALVLIGATRAHRRGLAITVGAVSIVLGALMALWPDAGAPWLAFLAGVGIVLHGIVTAVEAFMGRADHRAAAILSALASILVGVVAFSWPVLTVTLFRFGIGAWLIFSGIQSIIALVLEHREARRTRTAPSRFGMWMRTIGASLALLLAAGLAAGSSWILGAAPLASPDAFYTPPADVPSERGQLIRVEPLTVGVPAGAEAFKILYTTTYSDGSPAISSGTVLLPAKRGADPLPLVTVAHGTTGVAAQCAPSLSVTPFADGAGTALEEMVTKHGWAAVTSDYIGLGTAGPHPYLLGDVEARNALDASVAARQLEDISIDTRTVVWGHSQGGQGALWAGQIADDYAPELETLGIAAFAPAADLYGLADMNKNDAAGKTVSAYIAATWDEIFPELELDKHLTPGSARGVNKIKNLCFNGKDVLAAILQGTQVPNQVFPDSLLEGQFGTLLKDQNPKGPFVAPVMVAQGLADPLVKPELQDEWVKARCATGEAIDYRTFPGLDHTSLVAAASPLTPQIVEWTLDRWNGDAPTPTCG